MTSDQKFLTVAGFPKSGTTALMRHLQERDREFHVIRSEKTKGDEVVWPEIRSLREGSFPMDGKIVAHKFSGYIYRPDALKHLASNDHREFVLCLRHPLHALVSWRNMHRTIATEGRLVNHFAFKQRDFYRDCSIGDYYDRLARKLLKYDEHIAGMFEIVGVDRCVVMYQAEMAINLPWMVSQIVERMGATPLVHPQPAEGERHVSYAEKAKPDVPDRIVSELDGVQERVDRLMRESGVTVVK